jgi:hypothetical protein
LKRRHSRLRMRCGLDVDDALVDLKTLHKRNGALRHRRVPQTAVRRLGAVNEVEVGVRAAALDDANAAVVGGGRELPTQIVRGHVKRHVADEESQARVKAPRRWVG